MSPHLSKSFKTNSWGPYLFKLKPGPNPAPLKFKYLFQFGKTDHSFIVQFWKVDVNYLKNGCQLALLGVNFVWWVKIMEDAWQQSWGGIQELSFRPVWYDQVPSSFERKWIWSGSKNKSLESFLFVKIAKRDIHAKNQFDQTWFSIWTNRVWVRKNGVPLHKQDTFI